MQSSSSGLKILEKPKLLIKATDADGIETTQTINDLKLNDRGEYVHKFLVPQRLSVLSFTLSGRVFNHSQNAYQDVQTSESINCNQNLSTNLVGSFYLREIDKGYRILALGRNGEPIPRLPVSISFQSLDVTFTETATLATDATGELELGALPRISLITLSAQGVQSASFSLERVARDWPTVVHVSSQQSFVLPLSVDAAQTSSDSYSLTEIRHGAPYRHLNKSMQLTKGSLKVSPLEPGHYELRDRSSGALVTINVVETLADNDSYLVDKYRMLEKARRYELAIEEAVVQGDSVRIKLNGFDDFTRVHVIAHAMVPTLEPARQAMMPHPTLQEWQRYPSRSLYVDSLQLDEEYSYILQRAQATKYPGNLLPQPGLLIHPWEISLTDNLSRQAQVGDPMPAVNAPAPASARAEGREGAQKTIG